MSLETLIEQRASIDKQIEEAKKSARKDAVKTIKELMAKHELTIEEITRTGNGAGTNVPPKWLDPVTGAKWTGRGKKPLFIREAEADGTLENCRIV